MASNGDINRGIQLIIDVIDVIKCLKEKYLVGMLSAHLETTQLAECDCKFFRDDKCVSTLKPIPTGIY